MMQQRLEPPERVPLERVPVCAPAEISVLPSRADEPVTVIEPERSWQWINIGELWQFRELVFFLAWRDVKVRYKQTVLGAAWAVLQPALMMVVFTIFFGRLAGMPSGGVWYPLFALCGLLPWFFFSTAVTNAANSLIGSERLITKVYFPRLAVPFAAIGAAAVDFVVACGLLAVLTLANGIWPSWQLLLVPVVVAIVGLFAAGLGTVLSALNVSYRDFRYVVPFLIQIGMFATPTIYLQPTGKEGSTVRWLLVLNPLNSLVTAFRAAVLGQPMPWADLATCALAAILLFVLGCLYFRKVESSFVDVI